MAKYSDKSITMYQRLGRIGGLSINFAVYVAVTALSMHQDYRHGTEKKLLSFAAICIAVVYFFMYRRFQGRDIWVFAVFVLYAGIILVFAVYNFVEQTIVY